MIKITDEVYVAASEISEVGLNSRRDRIYIRTKSGDSHTCYVPYGVTSFTALDQLVKKIDEELE